VQIGDPSGRTTARQRQGNDTQSMNIASMRDQLSRLWINVKSLGIKHRFSQYTSRKRDLLNNRTWLQQLSAVDLMRDLGSGMRLGSMLARDSCVHVHCLTYVPSDTAQGEDANGERRRHGHLRVQLPALPRLRLVDHV